MVIIAAVSVHRIDGGRFKQPDFIIPHQGLFVDAVKGRELSDCQKLVVFVHSVPPKVSGKCVHMFILTGRETGRSAACSLGGSLLSFSGYCGGEQKRNLLMNIHSGHTWFIISLNHAQNKLKSPLDRTVTVRYMIPDTKGNFNKKLETTAPCAMYGAISRIRTK